MDRTELDSEKYVVERKNGVLDAWIPCTLLIHDFHEALYEFNALVTNNPRMSFRMKAFYRSPHVVNTCYYFMRVYNGSGSD